MTNEPPGPLDGSTSSVVGTETSASLTKRSKPKPTQQSEIARIDYEVLEEGKGLRFCAQAVGPVGLYTAGQSRIFTGEQKFHGFRTGYWYVERSKDAAEALDDLLAYLWANRWQPTAFGQTWHDFRLRRIPPKKSSLSVEPLPEAGTTLFIATGADVFEGKTHPSQRIETIQRGTQVTFVRTVGPHWLQVRLQDGKEVLVRAKSVGTSAPTRARTENGPLSQFIADLSRDLPEGSVVAVQTTSGRFRCAACGWENSVHRRTCHRCFLRLHRVNASGAPL